MATRKPLAIIAGKVKQWVTGDKLPYDAIPVGATNETVCSGDDYRLLTPALVAFSATRLDFGTLDVPAPDFSGEVVMRRIDFSTGNGCIDLGAINA